MAGKYKLMKAKSGKLYWTLNASNSQVILTSQQYKTRQGALGGIKSTRSNGAKESRFEIKKSKDGKQYFVLKAANSEIIGKSQIYKSASGLKNGIASIGRHAKDAELVDLTK